MQRRLVKFGHITSSLFILNIVISLCNLSFYNVFASSPSFPRKVATDDHLDEIDNPPEQIYSQTDKSQIYFDPTYGFSITYPRNWDKAEENDEIISELSSNDKFVNFLTAQGDLLSTIIGLYSPLEDDSDWFMEQLLINIHPSKKPLDELADEIMTYLKPPQPPVFRILSSQHNISAEYPSHFLELQYRIGDNMMIQMILLATINDASFVISLATEEAKLSKYRPIMEKMINSFTTYPIYPTDIKKITYLSNGKTLDATLWLAAPLNENYVDNMTFGLVLDTDLNQLPDYQIEVTRSKNGTLSRTVGEFEPISSLPSIAEKKFLNIRSNYSNFFEEGKSYVTLSTDLDAIGSPIRYKALFYSIERNEENYILADFTNWINIPPPEISISTKPNPITLRQGQDTTGYVTINSTSGFLPTVDLSIENSTLAIGNQTAINYGFENEKLSLPYFGTLTVPLHISVLDNAPVRKYPLHIFATLTIPPEFPLPDSENEPELSVTNLSENNIFSKLYSVKSESIVKQANLEIVVEPSLPVVDQALEFLNKFQFPITFISGILAGHILPWLFNKFGKRGRTIA